MMIRDIDNDLNNVVNQIEDADEMKELELKNQLRLKLEAKMRLRLILIWLPIVGIVVVTIIWFVVNTPNYDGCYKGCLSKAGEVTTQSMDDCQFYCHIKYSK